MAASAPQPDTNGEELIGAATTENASGGSRSAIWSAVDRLIDSAPSVDALYAHRLDLLAARRLRDRGLSVPPALVDRERLAAVLTLVVPTVLRRVSESHDGPFLVLKGPGVARHYPDPTTRIYRDLDVLAEDAPAMQRALIEAGFYEVGEREYFVGAPHERPLRLPAFPLLVEVHGTPNWPPWLNPPDTRELLEAAVPASFGPVGTLVPVPAHHALVVAAHAWTHGPLSRLRDLLDVALLAEAADRAEINATARRWGVERLWRTTVEAATRIFQGERLGWPLSIWAKNLEQIRERTVLETHLGRLLCSYSSLPAHSATWVMMARVGTNLRPLPGESWRGKVQRAQHATRNAFAPKSLHDRSLNTRMRFVEEQKRRRSEDSESKTPH